MENEIVVRALRLPFIDREKLMKRKTNRIAGAISGKPWTDDRDLNEGPSFGSFSNGKSNSNALNFAHPDMERRLRARRVWEFLDESRSKFYGRMNPNDPSFDPLFPKPTPTSSTGRGNKRWKLGELIAWLHMCEAGRNDTDLGGV